MVNTLTTTLVVGATGMTGRSLVDQLLDNNHKVRVVVRSREKLSAEVLSNPKATGIEASVLDLTDEEMARHVRDCGAVISCLGHVMDFKGMFGEPKKLCTDATRRLCDAIEKNASPETTKFILMNTVGVKNPELGEKRAWFERSLLFLLRHLLPPHKDNETAAEYLHRNIEKGSKHVEWCSVRPDSLIDAEISPYDIQESPSTGIFTGRPTTRANVAKFMTELVENTELWNIWKFRMPVIMNAEESVQPVASTSSPS
jgi:nucleoside-diphosphate-sugar epimerase